MGPVDEYTGVVYQADIVHTENGNLESLVILWPANARDLRIDHRKHRDHIHKYSHQGALQSLDWVCWIRIHTH